MGGVHAARERATDAAAGLDARLGYVRSEHVATRNATHLVLTYRGQL